MKRYTPDFYFSISKRRNASNKRPGVYLIFIQLLFSYIDITYKSMLLFIIIFWRYMQYLTLMTPYLALWAPWISHVLSNLINPIYFLHHPIFNSFFEGRGGVYSRFIIGGSLLIFQCISGAFIRGVFKRRGVYSK